MPYTANIPQPADIKSQSQGQILNNFLTLGTWAGIDHVTFDAANQGTHAKVSLPSGPNPPTNAFPGIANGMFCSAGTHVPGIRQTYGRIETAGPANVNIPYTESILATTTGALTEGWTYLPSGILLKWGQATIANPNATLVINVNIAGNLGPNYTRIYCVVASGENAPLDQIISATTNGVGQITLDRSSTAGNKQVRWFTIGS